MVNTVDGFPVSKIENYNLTPCDVLFKHTKKPEDYIYCRSINVYDDRWRVNVYSKIYVDGIEGKRISKSYFVHFNKATGDIDFVSPNITRSPQC